MAIQIRGNQVANNTLGPTQIDETATYDFSSGVVSVATPSAAAHAATKAYVDSKVPDAFAGGDGIAISDGAGTDTISVDLATNPGLQFTSNKLDVKVKSETGGTITKDGDGLYIADNAIGNAKLAGSIANAKLANSTISGKALGGNLDNLVDGNGIADFTYNGSAGVSIALDLDGSSLALSADGIKINNDGVGNAQIADNAVQNAQIQNGAVSIAKLAFQARVDQPSTSGGSTAVFALSNQVAPEFESFVMVFRNGLLQQLKASSPADDSEYTVSTSGGTTSVTFGANISASDKLEIRYLA